MNANTQNPLSSYLSEECLNLDSINFRHSETKSKNLYSKKMSVVYVLNMTFVPCLTACEESRFHVDISLPLNMTKYMF